MIDAISVKRAETCHPAIRNFILSWLNNCSTRNIGVRITSGYRSVPEQDVLYAQGRTTPGGIVTNAKGGKSWHNYGLAFDFCLFHKDKTVTWDMMEDLDHDGVSDWMEAVDEAKKLGFAWGGDWTGEFQDYPHFQMTFGLSKQEAHHRYTSGLPNRDGFIPINKGNK